MLVRHLLQSGIFISLVSVLNSLQAATIPVGVPSGTASGFNDYQFTANVTLDIPDGINLNKTVGGRSVVSNLPNAGTLRFLGSSIVTGDVGIQGGNAINNLLFRNPINSTVIFQDQVDVVTIDSLLGNGTVIFEQPVGILKNVGIVTANKSQFVFQSQAKIDNVIFLDESKVQFNSIVDFAGSVDLRNNSLLILNGGGSLALGFNLSIFSQVYFGDDFNINEDVVLYQPNSTITTLSGKTVTIGNDFVTVPDAVLGFDLDLTPTPGLFDVLNDANIVGNEIVSIINPGLPSYAFGTNGPVTLVQSANATILAAPELNAPNNLFISFDLSVDGTNKLLQLTGTRVMPTGLQNNIAGVADILGSITTANAPNEFIDLGNQLGLYYGTEAQKIALASAAPMNDGALNQVIVDIQQNAFDLLSKRIEEQFVYSDNYHTGYAAGVTNEQGNGSWVKLFGSNQKQSTRQNILGYNAGVWGVALGVDSKVSDTNLLGAGFSWATASISHDVGGSNTNINQYQGTLYTSNHNENAFFLNGMLSLAYHQYDSAHRIAINSFNRTNFAHFHGWQYAARLENGYHYKLKQDLFEIQPIISLNYTHANFNTYQEKGSSLTAQKIDYKNMDSLTVDVGVKVLDEIKKQEYKFVREAHASVGYDVLGNKQKSTAQYIGFGTTYQTTSFSPARTYYNMGLSLTTYGQGNIGVSLGYDYTWKQNYHAHAGFLKLRYDWF